jgi:hypothetical protein
MASKIRLVKRKLLKEQLVLLTSVANDNTLSQSLNFIELRLKMNSKIERVTKSPKCMFMTTLLLKSNKKRF